MYPLPLQAKRQAPALFPKNRTVSVGYIHTPNHAPDSDPGPTLHQTPDRAGLSTFSIFLYPSLFRLLGQYRKQKKVLIQNENLMLNLHMK